MTPRTQADPTRERRPRRIGPLVVIALLASLLLGTVGITPAAAASVATYTGTGAGRSVSGSYTGGSLSNTFAGQMKVTIDGVTSYAYCIDIRTGISTGATAPEVDWATSGINNLDVITGILHTYDAEIAGTGPAGYTLVGEANDRAAAIQSAIWHYSDGFDLSTSGNVATDYATILRAVADGALLPAGQSAPSLELTPTSLTGDAGDVLGPIVVDTTSPAVAVSVTGADLVDSNGVALSGPFSHGDALYLHRSDDGTATVDASAQAEIRSGRVFARMKDGKPEHQRLILAKSLTSTTTATATATWAPAPPPAKGSLTVDKVVTGSVDATGTALPSPLRFDVAITGPNGFSETHTISAGSPVTLTDLDAGDYTVREVAPSPTPRAIAYSPTGGTVTVRSGDTATVTVTNTYYGGAQPTAVLDSACGAGITGTLRNMGDTPVTFTVEHALADGTTTSTTTTVAPGGAAPVAVPSDAVDVTVTAPGMAPVSESFDPEDCFELGSPTFTLACDVAGSTVTVELDDDGTLPSTYQLFVDGTQVGGDRVGDFTETIPVVEGSTYVIEVRSGSTVVGTSTITVRCYDPAASIDLVCSPAGGSIDLVLSDNGSLASTFAVTIAEDGGPAVVEPGATSAGTYRIPVDEGSEYVVAVTADGAPLATETFLVDCAQVAGFDYSRSCAGYEITLVNDADPADPGARPVSYTVEVTIDGTTTTRVHDLDPGDPDLVVTGTVPEGAQARVEVREAIEGQLVVDEWLQLCNVVPPTTTPPATTPPTTVPPTTVPPTTVPPEGPPAPPEDPEVGGVEETPGGPGAPGSDTGEPPSGASTLPRTGSNPLNYVAAAAALGLLGGALLVLERHRMGTTHQ